jgi:hypothetical protein
MNMKMDKDMGKDMEIIDTDRTRTQTWKFKDSDVRYRISVKSFICDKMSVCSIQSDIGGSDIRLSLILFITDIKLSAHLCLAAAYSFNMHHQYYRTFSARKKRNATC